MDQASTALVSSLLGVIFGGLSPLFLQRQNFKYQLRLQKQQNSTEFMAEETVKHFLNHKTYTDRSFDVLKRHIGGFEDDELRKILVRAGAIRIFRDDGSELWRLLSRMEEYVENKQQA